jgi:hypothetical protein
MGVAGPAAGTRVHGNGRRQPGRLDVKQQCAAAAGGDAAWAAHCAAGAAAQQHSGCGVSGDDAAEMLDNQSKPIAALRRVRISSGLIAVGSSRLPHRVVMRHNQTFAICSVLLYEQRSFRCTSVGVTYFFDV